HPIEPGWKLIVCLKEPMGALGCYVGEVQAVDARGFRLTLMDWVIGAFLNDDCWIPWDNVLGMIVKTDEPTLKDWDPGAWQTRHEEDRKRRHVEAHRGDGMPTVTGQGGRRHDDRSIAT